LGPAAALVNLGSSAPQLKLPDLEKSIFELNALKGKKVLLNFGPAGRNLQFGTGLFVQKIQ